MSVNLSSREFRQAGLVEAVSDAPAVSGLDPRWLELELTESMIMQDIEATVTTLRALKSMGLSLAVDDFGTGYSSLSYLKRFPLDTLKIDASFTKDIPEDPDSSAITAAIIALAQTLKLDVVAEGVENKEQLAFLQGTGCDIIQGYLFSPPVPAEALPQLVLRQR